MTTPRFLITASPHLAERDSTPKIMWHVVLSLLPVVAASIYFFGPSAVLVIAASLAGCLMTEWVFGKRETLLDGSAVITGLLLGLILPAGIPLWMAFAGGVFSIGFGKLIFGGLGQNIFNPALLGRAFLQRPGTEHLQPGAAGPGVPASGLPRRADDVARDPRELVAIEGRQLRAAAYESARGGCHDSGHPAGAPEVRADWNRAVAARNGRH
jgi:hypothetical protein